MNSNHEDRNTIEVQVSLINGDSIGGVMFIKPASRITDMLNDNRAFIPLKDGDEFIHIIAKTNIAKVFIKEKRDGEFGNG